MAQNPKNKEASEPGGEPEFCGRMDGRLGGEGGQRYPWREDDAWRQLTEETQPADEGVFEGQTAGMQAEEAGEQKDAGPQRPFGKPEAGLNGWKGTVQCRNEGAWMKQPLAEGAGGEKRFRFFSEGEKQKWDPQALTKQFITKAWGHGVGGWVVPTAMAPALWGVGVSVLGYTPSCWPSLEEEQELHSSLRPP